MTKKKLLIDRRLIGYWKSDRQRTFRDYVPKRRVKPKTLRRFKAYFGKLTIYYGYRQYCTDLKGEKDIGTYEVIASDHDSVVIMTREYGLFDGDIKKKDTLTQIHFDGPNHYWVWVRLINGDFREFFKRIPKLSKVR